jgi:hypothetical protein
MKPIPMHAVPPVARRGSPANIRGQPLAAETDHHRRSASHIDSDHDGQLKRNLGFSYMFESRHSPPPGQSISNGGDRFAIPLNSACGTSDVGVIAALLIGLAGTWVFGRRRVHILEHHLPDIASSER